MRPLRTLSTVLEMIKFGRGGGKYIIFNGLPYSFGWCVSKMSAGGTISTACLPLCRDAVAVEVDGL